MKSSARRHRCIELISHWVDNIHRDAGIIAPYLFVILSIVSVALEELEWACVNSVRNKRQLFIVTSEKYMQMATSHDDSFPLLLQVFLTLRSLLLNNIPSITEFASSYMIHLRSILQDSSETLLQRMTEATVIDDWMRAVVQMPVNPDSSNLVSLVWRWCLLQKLSSEPEAFLYERTEIPHLATFYQMMYAFCNDNYTLQGEFGYQFNFLDLIDMLTHSHQTLPRGIDMIFAQHTEQIISALQMRIMDGVKVIMRNEERLLYGERVDVWDDVDREELNAAVLLLQRYRAIQQGEQCIQ